MKKLIAIIAVAAACIQVGAQEYLPKWENGYFDIYTIATGMGESSFLIFPDGTKMLIDCGDLTGYGWNGVAVPDASKSPAQWIARFIEHFGGAREIDYFLLSHFHEDHFGVLNDFKRGKDGFGYGGVTELVDLIRVDKWIDRGWPDYNFPADVLSNNKSVAEYAGFVKKLQASGVTAPEKIQIGSHKQVRAKSGLKSFDVWNLAASGVLASAKGSRKQTITAPGNIPLYDENAYSIAQLFTYGKFSYYSGGDLPGGNWKAYSGPTDRDFESRVADLIGHPVTVVKAGHHGCPDSCNPYFLWTLRPQAIVVSCSNASHPYSDTVQRIMDPHNPCGKLIYPTQETGRARMGDELADKLQPAGHIVVRVYEGGKSYQIFVLDSKSTDYRIISKTNVIEL